MASQDSGSSAPLEPGQNPPGRPAAKPRAKPPTEGAAAPLPAGAAKPPVPRGTSAKSADAAKTTDGSGLPAAGKTAATFKAGDGAKAVASGKRSVEGKSTAESLKDLAQAEADEVAASSYADRRQLRKPSLAFDKVSVERRLYEEPYYFDFFQAVRILERLAPRQHPVGRSALPKNEVVRFRALQSLVFPPSSIYELTRPTEQHPTPQMTVAFFGLTGPSGVLPLHYTDLIMRLRRDVRGPERYCLRDFLDIFNHRLVSLFYRAWEKYRFFIHFERGEPQRGGENIDAFTLSVFSLVGLGTGGQRGRMNVSRWVQTEEGGKQEVLAEIDDLALLHYSGILAHRPRCAVSLETMLADYFGLPLTVNQFQGQWLKLDVENRSRVGLGSCTLGQDLVLGDRIWDVQGKFRIRLGPLTYGQFSQFLPDRANTPNRKAFFLLCHLVRLYAGPEFDFDAQLVLKSKEVPQLRLVDDPHAGPRLGWNTWLHSDPLPKDPDDAIFQGVDLFWLNEREAYHGRRSEV